MAGGVGRACATVVLGVTAATLAAASARAASPAGARERPDAAAQPWVILPLASLGVPAIPQVFLEEGASMLTVHLVDDTHLLVTFSTRGLVPRVPGDPPDDDDRMVAAELVELPAGTVLARTDWHMHDHGRYLWRIGRGRFLLRIRRDLFVLAPEARLKEDDPLRPVRFPTRQGQPLAAIVSPDDGMLMVETAVAQPKAAAETAGPGMVVDDAGSAVMIDFYRLAGGDAPGSPLRITGAGAVRAPEPILLPVDADGFLWPGDPKRGGRWPVSFNEFGGRQVRVGSVDSSCEPRLQMVSRFEYLAFTCMGTSDRSRLKAYGMDGHETWEDNVGGSFGLPEFAFAPAAGRFAMSRISAAEAGEMPDLGVGSTLPADATQEVRVYQTESGDLLLKVQTTPVTRFAENFDLSSDGLVAAVVRNGAVEVYKLRAPSQQDVKDLELAKSFSPPASEAPVQLPKLEMADGSGEGDMAGNAPAGSGSGGALAADAAGARVTPVAKVTGGGLEDGAGPSSGPVAGDVSRAGASQAAAVTAPAAGPDSGQAAAQDQDGSADGGRRKPPTLLEPGESVETVKGSGEQPN